MPRRVVKRKGTCIGCSKTFISSKSADHVVVCPAVTRILEAAPQKTEGFMLRVSSDPFPDTFYLILTIPTNATFEMLDEYVKDLWLECCGHLSLFNVDGITYMNNPFGGPGEFRPLTTKLGEALSPGRTFSYDYDMGSTTSLEVRVLKTVDVTPAGKVTLLLRNNQLPQTCECQGQACMYCSVCKERCCVQCGPVHECPEFLPEELEMVRIPEEDPYMIELENTPREGECGYEGPQYGDEEFRRRRKEFLAERKAFYEKEKKEWEKRKEEEKKAKEAEAEDAEKSAKKPKVEE